jgi:hypothetical protein
MLDTQGTPGQLVLAGCRPSQSVDFHCYQLWKRLAFELYQYQATPLKASPLDDQLFASSLTAVWGVLGLVAPENQAWLRPERFERFLGAVIGMWDEICAVGERYFWDLDGESMWAVPSNLHFVLANLGVSRRQLNGPLPRTGLRGLLPNVQIAN